MKKRSKNAWKKHVKQLRKRLSLVEPSYKRIRVTPQRDHTLLLRFEDGKIGVYNMWPLIDGGDSVFAPLIDPDLFMKAYIERGSVGWPNNISITAEELYANCMSIPEYEQWLAECEEMENEAFGTTWLRKDDSGLPDNLYLDDSGYLLAKEHRPVIKFQANHNKLPDFCRISMSISDEPEILIPPEGLQHDLTSDDIQKVKQFVKLNKDYLLRLGDRSDYNYSIVEFYDDMVLLDGMVNPYTIE